MKFVDYLVIAVIVLILAGACFAVYKSKKSGKKCIGCPDSGNCSGRCMQSHNSQKE